MHAKAKTSKGFTLVELAIVIVIIGLLVGGVLQGQELINQSKIRAQVAQFEAYNAAALTFKAKYNTIPGDATPTQINTFGFTQDPAYCTGCGNGILNDYLGGYPPVSVWQESLYFFINMSQKQFIKDGLQHVNNHVATGVNVPTAKIGDGGILAVSDSTGQIFYYLGTTYRSLGDNVITVSGLSPTPMLATEQAYGIDAKLDDGLPSTGLIRATTTALVADTTASSCITSTTNNTYYLTNTAKACRLLIKTAL